MRFINLLVAALFVLVTSTSFAGEGPRKSKKNASKAKVTKSVKKQAKAAKAAKKAEKRTAKKAKPKPTAEPPPAPVEPAEAPEADRDVASDGAANTEAAEAADLGTPEGQPEGPGTDEIVDGDSGEIGE